MDGRRGRLAAALTAVFICALGATGTARAATFTSQPPPYVKPGAAPLTWTFTPATPDAPVAWQLGGETAWHRCTTDGTATLTGLPEGRYQVLIADDADDCVAGDTSAPARPGIASYTWTAGEARPRRSRAATSCTSTPPGGTPGRSR